MKGVCERRNCLLDRKWVRLELNEPGGAAGFVLSKAVVDQSL